MKGSAPSDINPKKSRGEKLATAGPGAQYKVGKNLYFHKHYLNIGNQLNLVTICTRLIPNFYSLAVFNYPQY